MFDFDTPTDREQFIAARQRKEAFMKRLIIGGATGLFVLIFGLILFANSHTVVEPGYAGVKYSLNGGIQDEVLDDGWNWHSPFVNVLQYPISTEIEKRLIEEDEDGEVIDNGIQLNTGDGKSVAVAFTYNYKMQQDKLPHIATKFRRQSGPQIADGYIDQQIINYGQSLSTKHSVLEVYSQKRADINRVWFDQLKKDLSKDGIILEEFTIVDVIPDAKTVEILQKIANAETEKEAIIRERANIKEKNKNITEQNANDKLKAEGNKAVAIVKAQEQAEIKEINARAEAIKIKELAQAEADANTKVAKSVSPSLIEYKKWNNWDGKWPMYMLGDDTSMFLGK